jgi:hypothetical protein
MPVCAGSRSVASIARPCDAIGPTRAISANVRVGLPAGRAAAVLRQLPRLADAQQLAHPRRRGGERVERARGGEQVAEAPGALVQVLLQRVRRVDRDGEQSVAEQHLALPRATPPERRRGAVLPAQLRDDRAQPAARGGDPERDRDRRLADAALPGHEQQPLVGQARHRREAIHRRRNPRRRYE